MWCLLELKEKKPINISMKYINCGDWWLGGLGGILMMMVLMGVLSTKLLLHSIKETPNHLAILLPACDLCAIFVIFFSGSVCNNLRENWAIFLSITYE